MSFVPRAVLLGLLALPLAAQGTGLSVFGGLSMPFDSLKKATHGATAFQLGADYHTRIWSTEVPARVGIEFATMPGKEEFGLKTSLNLVQFHADLLMDTPSPAWHPILGLSLNSYSMSKSGTENVDDPLDRDHHFPVRDVKGLKMGFRVGLHVALTGHAGVELMFQQTELAGKDVLDPLVRAGGINPAWLELNFRYRF